MGLSEEKVVRRIQRFLAQTSYISEPRIPGLSFRPDFMIDGDDIALFLEVCSIKRRDDSDWKTLRLIESLFELKLFFGGYCSFNLIITKKAKWKPYCLELLEGFFDKVVEACHVKSFSDIYVRPNQNNETLWYLERKSLIIRDLPPITTDVLEKFKFSDMEAPHTFFEGRIREVTDNLIQRHVPVYNLKNYYLKSEMNLNFYFDFLVNDRIIDLVSFKRLNKTILQNLLIKARLIRYEKIDGEIRQKKPFVRMILIVNGSIKGPGYDQLRYLRMLTAAGWDVFPLNLDIESLRELVQ